MANSNVYKIGTTTELGTTLNESVANSSIASSATTGALVANTYYAYIDGYTSNSLGSQQGTGLGYQVRMVFRFGSPNTTKRTVHLYVAAFFRRKDYVGSNNNLSLKMVVNNSSGTKSQQLAIPSSWVMAYRRDVTLNYTDEGKAITTVQLTGSNDTGSCASITCKFQIQAPNITANVKTATLTLSNTKATLGSTNLTLTHSQVTNIKTNISISFKDAVGKETVYSANIVKGNTVAAVSYKPALDIAKYLTDRTSVNATIKCVTYKSDGTTKVGSKSYSITLQVPDSVKQNISSLAVTNSDGTVPSDGYKIGIHKPRVAIGIDSTNAYGATITKIEVNFGTETLTYTNAAGNLPTISNGVMYVTSTKYLTSSSQVISVIMTDSRGRVSSKTVSVAASALDTKPAITWLNVGRGTGTTVSRFVDSDEGANCRVKYTAESNRIKAEISAGNSFTSPAIVITVQYKKTTDSTFTNFSYTTPANTNGTVSGDFIIPINDTENAYVIRITASDQYGSIYRETNLSSGFVLLELNESGKGIGIGEKATESNSFLVGLVTKFRNTVYNSAGSIALTSDERRKNNINLLSELFTEDILLDIFAHIDPISFLYNDQKNDLTHFGFSANKIKDILDKNGIDSDKYSIVEEIQDTLVDHITQKETIMKFLTLRYEEIIPILFLMIKILLRELNNINTRVEQLEEE